MTTANQAIPTENCRTIPSITTNSHLAFQSCLSLFIFIYLLFANDDYFSLPCHWCISHLFMIHRNVLQLVVSYVFYIIFKRHILSCWAGPSQLKLLLAIINAVNQVCMDTVHSHNRE